MITPRVAPTSFCSASKVADTPLWRGQGQTQHKEVGYKDIRIMKYTLHSSDTSSHFTSGPQIPQVTQPCGWLTPSHTSAQNHSAPSSTSTPTQPCSLYWSAHSGVTQPQSELPSCSAHLSSSQRRKGIKYPSWFCSGRKVRGGGKRKKNIQEMKVVTRSSVCQASPWAGTKGPGKGCWVLF